MVLNYCPPHKTIFEPVIKIISAAKTIGFDTLSNITIIKLENIYVTTGNTDFSYLARLYTITLGALNKVYLLSKKSLVPGMLMIVNKLKEFFSMIIYVFEIRNVESGINDLNSEYLTQII